MSGNNLRATESLMITLRHPLSFSHASNALYSLLDLFNDRLADVPSELLDEVVDTLTGGVYSGLFEDVDASSSMASSPLLRLYYALARVLPAAYVDSMHDCKLVATKVFQRLKERQVPLSWRMVHPVVCTDATRLTGHTIEKAFALQRSIGQVQGVSYPVVFTLDYPVVCMLRGMYVDPVRGLRQQTFVAVVRSGFLRMTVMPSYVLGYEGFDGLVWLQKGFRVRVGGFQLPAEAVALHELGWQLTDYRLARRVACHPETGVVVRHDARLLVR